MKTNEFNAPFTENWIFKDKPSITFQIENPNDVAVTAHIMMMLSSDKEMHFYPEMQHAYPPNWNSDIMKFFKTRIK